MRLTYSEAPKGEPLDGLIDQVDLPNAIRLIARPNMKTAYPLALDILTSLGHGRALPGKGRGTGTPTTLVTAWALAQAVDAVYIGEAQDLTAAALDECLDFAARIGASLHLIFGYGQVHTHADVLRRRGAQLAEFGDLPDAITRPSGAVEYPAPPMATEPPAHVPDDDWTTFRSAYRQTFDVGEADACDRLYSRTLDVVRAARPQSPDAVAKVIAELWQSDACEGHRRLVVARGTQAAMFVAGWNLKVKMKHLERYVSDRYLNPLLPKHYAALATFADPWRSAATALHAHHVPVDRMRTMTARSVLADGSVEGFEIDDNAKVILRAQRWTQLVGSTAPDPPLIEHTANSVRAAIRKMREELALPLVTQWRRRGDNRFDMRIGLTLEPLG